MLGTYFLRRLAVIIYTILLAFERAGSVVNCTVCIILRNVRSRQEMLITSREYFIHCPAQILEHDKMILVDFCH